MKHNPNCKGYRGITKYDNCTFSRIGLIKPIAKGYELTAG